MADYWYDTVDRIMREYDGSDYQTHPVRPSDVMGDINPMDIDFGDFNDTIFIDDRTEIERNTRPTLKVRGF